jgi:hypothetical protein
MKSLNRSELPGKKKSWLSSTAGKNEKDLKAR